MTPRDQIRPFETPLVSSFPLSREESIAIERVLQWGPPDTPAEPRQLTTTGSDGSAETAHPAR
jgi:hypothetical protein